MTDFGGAQKDDVVYLCREVMLHRNFERNQLFTPVGLGDGWIRCLTSGDTVGMRGPVTPNPRQWDLCGEPGRTQFLVRLTPDPEGRRNARVPPMGLLLGLRLDA